MVEGAEFGPVKYPTASPIAENGSEPATSVPKSSANWPTGIRTPPNAYPSANRTSTMVALKIMLFRTFAVKYANGGIGLARFTCSHPRPRSEASPDAVPNNDAPITPNVPYVAIAYADPDVPAIAWRPYSTSPNST